MEAARNHKLPNSPNNQRRCHGPAEKDRVHGKRDGSAGAHDKRTNNKAHASANYREYRKRRKHATGNGGDPGRYGALHQRAKPSGDHGREDEPGTALQERQPAKRTRNRSRRNRKRVGLNGGYTDRRPNAHIEFTGGREGNQDRKQIERDVCQADEQGEHTPLLGADPHSSRPATAPREGWPRHRGNPRRAPPRRSEAQAPRARYKGAEALYRRRRTVRPHRPHRANWAYPSSAPQPPPAPNRPPIRPSRLKRFGQTSPADSRAHQRPAPRRAR